jgi:glucodextranase-like protein
VPRFVLPLAAALATALAAAAAAEPAPAAAAAAPRLVSAFDDPARDAYGPGTYTPPGDSQRFTEGDFDLRRFAVYEDGDDVLLEVTLGAPVRQPAVTQREHQTELQLWNGIYLQNVDIYVDSDPTPGAGFRSCIPGRRIAFAEGQTWEAAVVITPQPGALRNLLVDAMGPAAGSVHVAQGLVVRGRTVTARIPAAALGGKPRADWGWSVQVSGARWERSHTVVDRVRGGREVDAFTMPVLTKPEAWAFGGAPAGRVHPRAVDVLLPKGVDQRAVLGSFEEKTGAFARVPFVHAEPPPAAPSTSADATAVSRERAGDASASGRVRRTVSLVVSEVSGELVTLEGAVAGLGPMRLGRVLAPDGSTVARVVVERVLEVGLLARAVDGGATIARGARVSFDVAP